MNIYKNVDNLRVKLWSIWLIGAAFLAVICACLVLMNHTIRTPPEPLKYEIIEFSVCKGWNNDGTSAKQTTFFPDERIFACGQLQTNHPITLSVDWYYEDEMIFTDIIHGVKDQFLSELSSPEEGFQEGSYELQLVLGKKTERDTGFEVIPLEEKSE